MMIDKFKPYLNDGALVEEMVAANGKGHLPDAGAPQRGTRSRL